MGELLTVSYDLGTVSPEEQQPVMTAPLCCLQSLMAFASLVRHWLPPSGPVCIKRPHHLSVPEECAWHRGPGAAAATARFSLHFGGDRRGRGRGRLTAGLLWLKAFLTGPCSLLVLSLAFFPSQFSRSPSFCCNVPVGYCLEY